jgi:MFS family permease
MSPTSDTSFTPRQRMLSLVAVISTSLGVGFAFGIGFPLTALTFDLWHQPKWIIGLAGAAPGIAIFTAFPFLPRLLKRLGPIAAISTGCSIGGACYLALYAFQTPWAWIVIRLIMSFGFALPWLAGETWLNSVAREDIRGRVIAIYAMAYFSGYAVGPFLLQTLGLTGFAPFAASAALTTAACLPIVFGRRLAPEFTHDETRDVKTAFRLAPVAMGCAFIAGFAEMSNLSLIPTVALASGVSADNSLMLLEVLTAGGIALQYPLGWLSDKISRFALTLYLAALFIALVIILSIALPDMAAAGASVFLLGGVILGFYSMGLAILGERVGVQDLAAANAAFIVMYQTGAIAGPIAAGVAMTVSPVVGFAVTMALLMWLAAVALAILRRREKTRECLVRPKVAAIVRG